MNLILVGDLNCEERLLRCGLTEAEQAKVLAQIVLGVTHPKFWRVLSDECLARTLRNLINEGKLYLLPIHIVSLCLNVLYVNFGLIIMPTNFCLFLCFRC